MFLKRTVTNETYIFLHFLLICYVNEKKSFEHFVIGNVQEQIRNELTKVFIKTSQIASNEVQWTRHSVYQTETNNAKIMFPLGVYQEGS